MRLTLRTLLAYLDDVLDPADKEELSEKIESSDFAKDLVHRSRDTMRRLRLSAPQVVGTGMGLDPNTVAEYLDNVLAPDQVADFERICLESDVHLAEAAACHHILTMVLGEPADVDPRTRQRMYQIATEARERKRHRAEAAHVPIGRVPGVTTTVVTPGAASAVAVSPEPARRAEVPEYLRTRSWWRSPALFAGLAVLLVAAIGLTLVSGLAGWFGEDPSATMLAERDAEIAPPPAAREPRNGMLAEGGMNGSRAMDSPPMPLTPGIEPAPAMPAAADSAVADAAPADGAPENGAVVSTPPPRDPYGPIDAAEAPDLPVPPVGESAVDAPEMESTTQTRAPPAGDALAATGGTVPPVTSAPDAIVEPGVAPAPPAGELPATTDARPAPEAIAVARLPDGVPRSAPPVAEADPAAPPVDEVPAPPGPAELGTYLSSNTVLLRHDEASGNWFRVEPRQAVIEGQRLLALPEFRPTIALASGIILDLFGGTQVVFATADQLPAEGLPSGEPDVVALDVEYGRLLLSNRSGGERVVRLKLGESVADARLARNAALAVEVERQFVPGSDPRKQAAPVVVRLYAADGDVEWQDANGPQPAAAGTAWVIAGGTMSEIAPAAAPPAWISAEPGTSPSDQLQRLAAPRVENAIVSNRPADIQLIELYQSNLRREVKTLVARAGIHVGLVEPFVSALRDSAQRWPTWKSHVQTLRTAMALSPESAEKVYQTLVQQRGEAAARDLYQMLRGYSPDQVGRTPEQWKTGAMAKLIDWLEEESLDYRVLAVYNLWEITGKQLMADPAARSRDRSTAVRLWRSRLAAGELQPLKTKQPGEEAAPAARAESAPG